jgi:hypothetical protein
MTQALVGSRGYASTLSTYDSIARRGFSGAVLLADPPPAGFQYEQQTVIYSGSGYSLQQGANPPVAVPDVFITPTTVTPGGYALQVNNDGTIEVFSGGDTSRQSFLYWRYDASLGVIDGPATCWVNEQPPVWGQAPVFTSLYIGSQVNINLAGNPYAVSPEGDSLVFSIISGGLPPGLSMSSSGQITGTGTQAGAFFPVIGATDITGTTTPASGVFSMQTQQIQLPNVADGYTRRYPKLKGRSNRPPPLNMDWQSLTTEEAEKLRRLDRKRRELWEGKPPQEEEDLSQFQINPDEEELPHRRPPLLREEAHPMVRALLGQPGNDDHEVYSMLDAETRHFIQVAQAALEALK